MTIKDIAKWAILITAPIPTVLFFKLKEKK